MSTVVFKNSGVMDIRSVKTFGVSAKIKDNAIGYFGTGMKYAIAILLREGIDIKLITGGEVYNFEKKDIDMRGQNFEIITMNGEDLPFTTRLGIGWNVWQAFRELYCNCMDENGEVYHSAQGWPDYEIQNTYFVVTGEKFYKEFLNRDEIVLNLPQSLLMSSGDVDAYDNQSKSLYYKGIRVMDFQKKAMLTYNVNEQIELTEDRTVKSQYSAMNGIPLAIAKMKNKPLIRRVLTASDEFMERDLSFSNLFFWTHSVSQEFTEVLTAEFKKNNDRLNKSARDLHTKLMNQQASKHYEPEPLNTVEQKQLDRCVDICSQVWTDFKEYRIMVVKNLGQETMALADMNENVMVISKKTFSLGTKFLMSTLIEEYIHLKTAYSDHSRQLQTHLFDQICTMIENHVIKEPI